jgi:hypothetical protein
LVADVSGVNFLFIVGFFRKIFQDLTQSKGVERWGFPIYYETPAENIKVAIDLSS